MIKPEELQRLVEMLAEKRVVNLDVPVRDLISSAAIQIEDPGVLAGWYVAGGDHYFIVCGLKSLESQIINQ
ncbi:MAG: hypothetical protein IT328_04070 [Caldilineaceae bacterium]|nr:hypothetical protein [Caldilineaceae bacterium]